MHRPITHRLRVLACAALLAAGAQTEFQDGIRVCDDRSGPGLAEGADRWALEAIFEPPL